MSHRTASWLACSLWALCVALIALAVLLDFFTADVPLQPGERLLRLGPGLAVPMGVLSLAYPTVGALIASRLPTNPIGWIFCSVGLLYGVRRFTGAYADYALFENIALPGGEHAAWFSTGGYRLVVGGSWHGRRSWEPWRSHLRTYSNQGLCTLSLGLRTHLDGWGS
jgi:hypothetical protein